MAHQYSGLGRHIVDVIAQSLSRSFTGRVNTPLFTQPGTIGYVGNKEDNH
nr:MAG TPA: hypothetical protein [Microviridae sp.]